MNHCNRCYTRPEFLTQEQLYRNLPEQIALGGDRYRAMLARVLVCVPYMDQLQLLAYSRFVMAGLGQGEYLSAAFVGNQSLVILDDGVLDLTEEEQVEIILPLAAQCVLKSRHRLETPYATDWDKSFNPETSAFYPKAHDREMKLFDDAKVDLKIDLHFSKAAAEALVQSWLAQWRARNSAPALCLS